MKLYLSSFRLGDNPEKLFNLFGSKRKVAVILNAVDFKTDEDRKASLEQEIKWLVELGLEPKEIDLRNYFNNNSGLEIDLDQFGGVWVRGGNTFILRKAYFQSGFDKYVLKKSQDKSFVYGGYSAGCCILCPSLKGFEIVDDPNIVPEGYIKETIWEGLELLDYYFLPHYKSDHPESAMVDKEYEELQKRNEKIKTLRDGEVIITETD